MNVELNDTAPLRVQVSDGNAGLFPQVKVYNGAGTVVATLSAAHVAGGLYTADWTPGLEGYFTAVYRLFTDAGHTLDAGYDATSVDVEVTSLRAALARILGLTQENIVIDLQVYDGSNNLTGARLRTYDSKANAQAAGGTGMLASYTLAASYTSGRLTAYSVVRDA